MLCSSDQSKCSHSFNIFISILDAGTESTFSKYADDAEVGGVVDRPLNCAVIQWDLGKLEKQVDISSVNKKGQFHTWGAITPCTSTGLGMTGWKAEKDLVGTRPTASWVS